MLIWKEIKKYLGWRNWAVFQYNSIFENLFVIFYLLLIQTDYDSLKIVQVLFFAFFSIFSTTYGYLINDFADRELDKQQGKPNTFQNDSTFKAVFVIIIILTFCILTSLPFIKMPYFLYIWSTWFLLSTFYSLPPLRLKEKGKFGLIVVIFAQRFVPLLLIFVVFNPVDLWTTLLLALYVFFRGLSSDLNHQVEDYKNDIKTETGTFAVRTGFQRSKLILRFSFEMEKILLTVILIESLFILKDLNIYLYSALIITAILYLAAYFYSLYYLITGPRSTDVNPFIVGPNPVFQFLHHSYPSVILALGLNFILIFFNPYFIVLFLMQLWMRKLFTLEILTNNFIFKILKRN